MAHIDYFFAPISPNTYMAGTRLEAIAEKHGASVTYKPLDLLALFARTGGTAPKDRHPSRMEYRGQELRRQAKKLGITINPMPPGYPPNPAPSSYALIAAQKAGGGSLGELVQAYGRACWIEERNIGEDDVIADCLGQAGFDPGLAAGMMLAEAEEYARNLEDAVTDGVFGAPFYVVDGSERFWGQDRLDDLDLYLGGEL